MYQNKKRKKFCKFTKEGAKYVDYKDSTNLMAYVTESGKILPSRITGTCAKFQRLLSIAIKRARFVGLLPYCSNDY